MIQKLIQELLSSGIPAVFEPEIFVLNHVRQGHRRTVCRKLSIAGDDKFISLPNFYGRNSTLAGICDFLDKHTQREFLVIAFGIQRGSSALFDGLHVAGGSTSNVSFTPTALSIMDNYIKSHDKFEILICHNHPDHPLKTLISELFGWSPLPSSTDRETMFQLRYGNAIQWFSGLAKLNLRFFLVDDGGLREFNIPSIPRVVDCINHIKELLRDYRKP